MLPELRNSNIELHTGLDHPMSAVVAEIANNTGPLDRIPVEDISMTVMFTTKEGISAIFCFGMVHATADFVYHDGPTEVRSTWHPVEINSATGNEYIMINNRPEEDSAKATDES